MAAGPFGAPPVVGLPHVTYVFQSAFADADRAWKNWLDSVKGIRAGRRVGYPRFKKRGRSRDSFRLHHDVKKPGIRLATHRRLRLASFGEVRLHHSAKRLARRITHGDATVQSVTVSRHGHRWYASPLCTDTFTAPGPTPTPELTLLWRDSTRTTA
ncbi:hypothetical protein [Streptomyces sp. NPDC017529]|uniref:hypothetical protein n=1 Tax=Streptomyces sp. NPDC017529 TaxID=3365000 RepID=UPI00379A015D